MLDSNKFAPLKSKTMYHPFGTSIGGGGGGMLMRKSELTSNKRGIYTIYTEYKCLLKLFIAYRIPNYTRLFYPAVDFIRGFELGSRGNSKM